MEYQLDKFLRLPQVIDQTGLSKASIYRLERQGDFPHRVSISPGTVGWRESEIDQWIDGRPKASQE
ncbi:MAG: AlpA family transcriptional regulator [Alphaproteobacteria bacterium]|nr:AlpA family transcriptional regulator [Alphaproteobacteria bacterium]